MFNKFFKTMSLSITLISLLCVGGVYASFEFAKGNPNDAFDAYNVGIGEFIYQNNTMFPQTESGKVTETLINNLINGTGEYGGLNYLKSALNAAINGRKDESFTFEDETNSEIIGSMDALRGQTLKKIIPEDSNLIYILYFPKDDDNYYVYSTNVEISQDEYTRISPVYKTTLSKGSDDNYYVSNVEVGSTLCNFQYYNYRFGDIYTRTINIYTWEAL